MPVRVPPMTPHEAAGRALYLIEHPCVDPDAWDRTDEPTRTYWVDRAKPITDAVRRAG